MGPQLLNLPLKLEWQREDYTYEPPIPSSTTRIMLLHYKVVLLAWIMLASNLSMSISVTCIEKERKALTVFKKSLADPSRQLSSWVGQDCCSWKRVTCNNVTGHVVKLDLGVTNYDDNNVPRLTGSEVSPSVAELEYLEYLDLSGNDFSSSKIPSFFGNFKSLRVLDLSLSSFAGVVPPSLGNLSSLQELYLVGNDLLKIDNLIWLAHLSSLQNLLLTLIDLSQVPLSQAYVFNSFPSLTALSLAECKLQFPLSSLSNKNFTNLRNLDLSNNSFSGPIPSSFFIDCPSLTDMDLSVNLLNGTVPESIGQLSNLESFSLGYNFFSGLVSETHFEKLSSLIWLDMGLDMNSNFLTMNVSVDWVPPFQLLQFTWGSCKFENGFPLWIQTQKSLAAFLIPNSKISGSYQLKDIVPLFPSKLLGLFLSNCSISGSIPGNIGRVIPHLHFLSLSGNNISGRIPISLCEIRGFYFLNIANNHLSGDLPQSCWSGSEHMSILDLSFNSLTGSLRSFIGNWSSITSLHLSNNMFFGELPVAVKRLKFLSILDLAHNRFSGNLPSWINKLSDLQMLDLGSNRFYGSLVHELCDLSKLQILNLAHNNFIGAIPSCYGNFSGMVLGGSTTLGSSFELARVRSFLLWGRFLGYSDHLNQVIKGRELDYTTTLGFLVNLDLSSNNLTGHILEELTFLSGLRGFNLSHNRLTGSIPKLIGNMKSLESLDFSHNHLTGMIPKGISEITSLALLNLSYNNLSGKIPTGNQLQTLLDPSIYEGNQGLCGTQIQKACAEDKPSQVLDVGGKSNDESEKLWFYIGLAVGVVVGFCGVLGFLVFKQ